MPVLLWLELVIENARLSFSLQNESGALGGMRAQIPPFGDLREGTQGRVAGWARDCDKRFSKSCLWGEWRHSSGRQGRGMSSLDGGPCGTVLSSSCGEGPVCASHWEG